MKRIIIELEIEGDAEAAADAVEGALDAGTLQDEVALMGAIGDGAAFTILSVTSRLEAEEESAPLAPVVNNPPPCPLRVGWDYFDDQEVQRDDEAALFEDDDSARAHIRGCSTCLMALTVEADGLPVEPLLAPVGADKTCAHAAAQTHGDALLMTCPDCGVECRGDDLDDEAICRDKACPMHALKEG